MESSHLEPGATLGWFRLVEREEDLGPLQRYRATHLTTHANALICVRDLRQDPPSRESFLAFREQAERLRAFREGTIPALLAADLEDGWLWAAFAYPTGTPLIEYTAEHGRLSPITAALLLRSIAASLHYARFAGAHGMLQSTAIYVDAEGALSSLQHFGVASLFGIGPVSSLHCPPEQWRDQKPPNARTDMYSAAAIVWEALAGCEPGASSEPNPDPNARAMLRFPNLKRVRPEVHEALCELLFEWTSHDENERPQSWFVAIVWIDCVCSTLGALKHTSPTALDLQAEESEPPTLPISQTIQVHSPSPSAQPIAEAPLLLFEEAIFPVLQVLSASRSERSTTADAPTPSTDRSPTAAPLPPKSVPLPLEHADTIPAPPPLSEVFAQRLPAEQHTKPALTETAITSTRSPPRRRNAVVWVAMAALIANAAGLILWVRQHRTASYPPMFSAQITTLANTLRRGNEPSKTAFGEPNTSSHNSNDAKRERPSTASRPQLQQANRPGIAFERFEPDRVIDTRLYIPNP